MSEFNPQHIEDVDQRVQEAIARVGDGLHLGPISVTYDQPAWDSGQVWIRGSCDDCGAERAMRSSGDPHHLRYLAMVIARYDCSSRGHEPRLGDHL